MHSIGVIGHSSSTSIPTLTLVIPPLRNVTVAYAIPSGSRRRGRYTNPGKFKIQSFLNKPNNTNYPAVVLDSLRLVEWDKVSDTVASFAGTSLGREALKAQLWSLNQTYEDSIKLLEETNAAVQMHKYGGCLMDFSCMDLTLVKSAIQHARRGMFVDGNGAIGVVALLEFAEALQSGIKAAIKEDADWYNRFMPLAEMINDLVLNQSLVKFIRKVVDDDGSVKDSASLTLKRSRDQVRLLEKKLSQLVESLIRNEIKQTPSLEASNIDGRWCLKLGSDMGTTFESLCLPSGSGTGSFVEPLSAVPLNDELQQARATVAKAEADVLIMITNKMQTEIDDLDILLKNMIKLDVINARATYSLSFKGACPHLFLPEDCDRLFTAEALSVNKTSMTSSATQKWILYLPRAYHPLLLQQHRQSLRKAIQDVTDATAEIWRRKQGGTIAVNDEEDIGLTSLKMQVKRLEQAFPIPVDIFVAQKIKVLVITGPNTGGKTICLKTVGLAAIMAKSGLYVFCSDPAKIPWFDYVFADIGDEQSLSQSLSTFSGHLKQITEIQLHSTNRSLVLLDEVGEGTNPLEGAALGMSLLESFAAARALLTIATTHHGELKTLKYSNDAFENACMEFDEVNLKPTYRILWGVPARSNAINIAEKLGLSTTILDNAHELHGEANMEINEIILDMEKLKRIFHGHIHEAQHYLTLSRYLHEKLLMARNKIIEHGHVQRFMKNQKVSEAAAEARSFLHKKVRQLCANARLSVNSTVDNSQQNSAFDGQHGSEKKTEIAVMTKSAYSSDNIGQPLSERRAKIPRVGDLVHVSSLNKKALVLKVEPSKGEIIVQVGNMKLKLLLLDVLTDR